MVAGQPFVDTARQGQGASGVRPAYRSGQGEARGHRPPLKRSDDQNRKFHAICADYARSGYEWHGCRRTAMEWKFLLITAHAIATGRPVEIVPNLEDGSPVQIRESSARMSVARSSSLIEYAISWAAKRGIRLSDDPA